MNKNKIQIQIQNPNVKTNVSANTNGSNIANGAAKPNLKTQTPLPTTMEAQQIQQRLYVKEQEVAALKVQNRHLISKLEEAEKKAEPNQINTQLIASEIQNQIKPLIGEIEKSLKESFEMLKSTMRGIYQQSQRAQQAVEDIGAHARELEARHNDQRKADQVYYQEKILSMVTSFGDRIDRQLDHRLRGLAVVELMNTKQNEVLADIEMIKGSVSEIVMNQENIRQELKNLIRDPRSSEQANIELITDIFSEASQSKRDLIAESKLDETILKQHKNELSNETDNNESEKTIESPLTLDYL
jgi:hypothetical protein